MVEREGAAAGRGVEGGRQQREAGKQTAGRRLASFPLQFTHTLRVCVCVWKSRMPSLGRGSARHREGAEAGAGRGYCGEATLKREKNRSLFLGKKRKLKP